MTSMFASSALFVLIGSGAWVSIVLVVLLLLCCGMMLLECGKWDGPTEQSKRRKNLTKSMMTTGGIQLKSFNNAQNNAQIRSRK